MSKKIEVAKKKCITPNFRVSFPNVFKAKAFENQEPKFSIVMLFDKNTDLTELKKAAHWACVEKWGEDKSKWPERLRTPFRDGNEKSELQGYEDKIFVSASSKTRPGLVDASVQPIINEADFYAGCWARAELIAFAYNTAGNVGVSFSLQNVQKVKDDQPFSGRKKATEVFEAVEVAEDDMAFGSGGDEDPFAGF